MRILWDEPKRSATLARRGLDFADLDFGFFETATVMPASRGRLRATGPFRGAILTVIVAPLGTEALAIVSMRHASRKERRAHDAQDPAPDR